MSGDKDASLTLGNESIKYSMGYGWGMRSARRNRQLTCSATPGQRVVYAVLAIILGAFSVDFFAESVIVALIVALLAAIAGLGAITGTCLSS